MVQKKKELVTAHIKKNPHYTNLEREKNVTKILTNMIVGEVQGPLFGATNMQYLIVKKNWIYF